MPVMISGAVVAAHQSKGGLESSFQSVSLKSVILHKWETLDTVASLPRRSGPGTFTMRSDCPVLKLKKPRSASHTLHASACLSL